MDSFFDAYFQDDVPPIVAEGILKEIDRATKQNWSGVDFDSNMYNVSIDLKNNQVKITGLMAEDPEVIIPLQEYVTILKGLIQNHK